MKSLASGLAFLGSACGLLTLNLVFSLPAQASITCEPGTISKHQNGSLSTCVLSQKTNLQVYIQSGGTSNFPCKAQNIISFDDKGQLQSCSLAEDLTIRRGNNIETCLATYRVEVAVKDGSLSITCLYQ